MRPLPISGVRCPCIVIQFSGRQIINPMQTYIGLETFPAVKFIKIGSEHWLSTTQSDRLYQLIDTWIMRH